MPVTHNIEVILQPLLLQPLSLCAMQSLLGSGKGLKLSVDGT